MDQRSTKREQQLSNHINEIANHIEMCALRMKQFVSRSAIEDAAANKYSAMILNFNIALQDASLFLSGVYHPLFHYLFGGIHCELMRQSRLTFVVWKNSVYSTS